MIDLKRPRGATMPRADLSPMPQGLSPTVVPSAFDRWNPGLAVRAAGGDTVIEILDVIGEDFWTGGGVTGRSVSEALKAAGPKPVTVVINSPGGDVGEGFAIYNLLRAHPADVTVQVIGFAASAASIIAMAGDRIEVGKAAAFMIHNAWVMAIGNQYDLAETVTWLAAFDQSLVGIYADRTGQKPDDLAAWMKAETWIFGEDAVSRGFADALLAADVAVETTQARVTAPVNALRRAELALCRDGKSRAEARRLLSDIRGKPGAAASATPGAGDTRWVEGALDFLTKLKNGV